MINPKFFGLTAAFMLISSSQLIAQSTLPKGVGLYQYGVRTFQTQHDKYGVDGELVGLGDNFNQEFSGRGLLSGTGGPELQRLAEELKGFDANSEASNSLIGQMNLGELKGTVQADVQATIFGLGFGLSKGVTLFMGAPMIEASVDTEIEFISKSSNTTEIKEALGEAAFEELKAGLDRAGNISTSTIRQNIINNGFEEFDHWERKGMGDFQIGIQTSNVKKLRGGKKFDWSTKTSLSIPTGYTEDADILTDVSFGKGYYMLTGQVAPTFSFGKHFSLGVDSSFGYNFKTELEKRVPEAEERSPKAERKVIVTLDPGNDFSAGSTATTKFSVFKLQYRIAQKTHYKDTYTGPITGNYEKMGRLSNSYQLYNEYTFGFDTVKAFAKKKFFMPLMLDFTYHKPILASNSVNEIYYQITFSSFFSTPMAKSLKSKKIQKRSSRTSQRKTPQKEAS